MIGSVDILRYIILIAAVLSPHPPCLLERDVAYKCYRVRKNFRQVAACAAAVWQTGGLMGLSNTYRRWSQEKEDIQRLTVDVRGQRSTQVDWLETTEGCNSHFNNSWSQPCSADQRVQPRSSFYRVEHHYTRYLFLAKCIFLVESVLWAVASCSH